MQPEASISVELMDREVCNGCGHLHRTAINQSRVKMGVSHTAEVTKCHCCLTDGREEPNKGERCHTEEEAWTPTGASPVLPMPAGRFF